MLRIVLKEFRCWKDLSIDIPLGEVTLIKGDSGCGKSTILQAILWCLYGKIQLVMPITKKVANTEVTLEFPFYFNGKNDILNINRTKSTRVTLSHSKDMYEDKVAQEIINDLFGSYDLWLASCYVGQGTRNTFLTAPNSGKMELLNSIAFHEEDPRVFIEKITEVLNEKNTIYNFKLSEYNSNLSILETMMSKIDINKALTEQQHKDITDKILIFSNELSKLKIIKQQYDIDTGILNNLHKQLSNLQDNILPEPNDNLRSLMIKYNYDERYNYQEVSNIITLLSQKEAISEKEFLDHNLLNDKCSAEGDFLLLPVFTMDDYRNTLNNENLFDYNYNSLLSLNINCNYDEESISNRITNMKNTISYNEYLLINKEYQELSNTNLSYIDTTDLLQELNKIKNENISLNDLTPSPNYSKYDVSSLNNDIVILQQKLLQNPINENINECNNITQKINDLNSELKILQKNKTIDSLNEKLSNLINKDNNLKNEIYRLELNNTSLKCPKCSESLNLENNKLVLYHDNSNHELFLIKQVEISTISDEISLVKTNIQIEKIDQIKQFNDINNEIKSLTNQLKIYDDEYNKLKSDHYKKINDEIAVIKKQINDIKFEEQKVKLTYEKDLANKKSELLQIKRDECNKLELKIAKLNSDNNIYLNNQKQVKVLEAKLNEYKNISDKNITVSLLNDLTDIKDKLQKLSNIKVIQKSLHESQYILQCIEYNDRKNKYVEIVNKIPLIWKGEKANDIKFYNEKVNEYVNLLNLTKIKKNQVDLTRKTINDQINKIQITDDPTYRINEIINLIDQYKNDISLSDEANKVVSFRNNLNNNRDELMKINSDLVNLQLLKQHALETECKSLQDVISSINSSIENVCSTLFDKEISIVLSLFKTIKSTKSIKPNVNFQISYKGGVFDNINSLSGGEGDRTSIALTLALYRLTSFPLLMLDETLASLHYDMKEATVETLSNIISQDKNRCVIVVLHDSVNGIFSNVIDLEEITEGRY